MKTIHSTRLISARIRREPAVLLSVIVGMTVMFCPNIQAHNTVYSFNKIAELGGQAPNGGVHINDFEPGAINNWGDVIYGTDLGTNSNPETFFGEGVFLRRARQASELELARSTGNAPGGGVFDFLLLGQTQVNDWGDAAFAFTLTPFGSPVGVNSVVYRYSRGTRNVTAVLVPDVTPAPGGGKFAGVYFNVSLNNLGALSFQGIIHTDQGVHVPGEAYIGLGMGVFKADRLGRITNVVSPGDTAPGGGKFDAAGMGGSWINNFGDIALTAHVAGEESAVEGFPPQAQIISALSSLYVKKARGTIVSVAHSGQAAPRGGVFRIATSPVMNDWGDIVFQGDISPAPHVNQASGVYLNSGGANIAVARPGDPMPGGGTFKSGSPVGSQQIHINNSREVVFNALLGTGGPPETGLFLSKRGSLRQVARTGTVIPGVGTIAQLTMGVIVIPPPPTVSPNSGAINNDRGQVLFGATLTDGRGVLLVATPHDEDGNDNDNNNDNDDN